MSCGPASSMAAQHGGTSCGKQHLPSASCHSPVTPLTSPALAAWLPPRLCCSPARPRCSSPTLCPKSMAVVRPGPMAAPGSRERGLGLAWGLAMMADNSGSWPCNACAPLVAAHVRRPCSRLLAPSAGCAVSPARLACSPPPQHPGCQPHQQRHRKLLGCTDCGCPARRPPHPGMLARMQHGWGPAGPAAMMGWPGWVAAHAQAVTRGRHGKRESMRS